MSKQVPHQRSLRLQPLFFCPFPPRLFVMQGHGDTDQKQEGGNTHRPEPANNSGSSSNKPMDKVGCEYCGCGTQTHPSQSQVAQHAVTHLHITTEAAAQRAPPGNQHANVCGHYHPTLSPNQR